MNILNVEKVSKTYGEKELFNNISLGINSGDKIGLIGVNGTGKSTLLKIIAGVEEPDEGQVVKGKGIELAYLAQTPLYYENENVLEYVMRGKHADSQPKAKEILNKLGITNHGAMMNILSGGQKKRAALARTLVEPARLLILDEPTTGLHTADVHRLTTVLDMLVNAGNTVVVIEHNLDIIKTADYIIDLGPEGGKGGGTIVKTGTPEEIADCENSYTGQYLKPLLKK